MTHAVSQARTRNYISQIKGSLVFKFLAVCSSFMAIPLMIRFLGQEQFGVWSTVLSVMSWIVFFDLGLGVGLRNKLSESLAKEDFQQASAYISSAYTLIGILSFTLFAIVACASFFIPWQRVFNTHAVSDTALKITVVTSAFFIFLNFWISLINQVLNAVQKTSVVVFGQFLSNTLGLVLVYMLTKTADRSLSHLAAVYGFSLIASGLLLSLWYYRQNSGLLPRLFLDRRHVQPLLTLGLQFFVIQIAVLIVFTTDKILITQLLGPQQVTPYEIVFKLFSVITLVHSLITAPLWSSYSDAYHRHDTAWLRTTLHRQLLIFGLISGAIVLLAVMARPLIGVWIGTDTTVSSGLIISMAALVLVTAWNNIFATLVNGIGQIKVQLLSAVVAMTINIPLAIVLTGHFGLGVHGVVWATCISLSLFAVVGPLQVHVLLKKQKMV